MNRVLHGFSGKLRTAIHVCRGNWSKREDVLITGDYQPLVDCFREMNVNQLVLEYATPRAGELQVIGRAFSNREIGLGCVNPRTDMVESVESIVARSRERCNIGRLKAFFSIRTVDLVALLTVV